jgi:hypothetical protein
VPREVEEIGLGGARDELDPQTPSSPETTPQGYTGLLLLAWIVRKRLHDVTDALR